MNKKRLSRREFLSLSGTAAIASVLAACAPAATPTPTAVPPYLARKMLQDLTPYFQASAILHPDDLAPANDYYKAADPLHIGSGKIYGMAKDWSPDFTLFAYKKSFADKNISLPDANKPLTYQQVYDLGKQLATFDGDRIKTFGFDYQDVWG